MADRIQKSNDVSKATFATENARCSIPLIGLSDFESQTFSPKRCWKLVEICNWAYGDKWEPDRLRLVQVAFANSLATERHDTCQTLLWRAYSIHENLSWHWKTFISDEVKKYTADEKTLEHEVADTVEKLDTQVGGVINSVSNTILGAVGVLIGTFIAAAFNSSFNAELFTYGLGLYAIYVVLFPGIYSMWHQVLAYQALEILKEEPWKSAYQFLISILFPEVSKTDSSLEG